MKKIFILICTLSLVLNQELFVYQTTSQNDESTLYQFNSLLISNIVDMSNKRNRTNYIIKMKYVESYEKLFQEIEKSENLSLGIDGITITSERQKKFDFSIPYMPVKEIIISHKKFGFNSADWKKNSMKIAVVENTIHEVHTTVFKKKYNINLVLYSTHNSVVEALDKGTVQFYIGDVSEIWLSEEFEFISDFPEAKLSYYGILYKKGSPLKKIFDSTMKYFLRSPKYIRIIQKYFGADVAEYYREVEENKRGYELN